MEGTHTHTHFNTEKSFKEKQKPYLLYNLTCLSRNSYCILSNSVDVRLDWVLYSSGNVFKKEYMMIVEQQYSIKVLK